MSKIAPQEYIKKHTAKRATRFTTVLFKVLMFFYCLGEKITYTYDFDKKAMRKKQVILLADHSSRNNAFYVLHGFPCGRIPNIVVGYHNILVKGLFKLILKMGVIPKYLYAPDTRASKNILRVLKSGASLCLFPEGIQSTCGSTHPMNPATIKLLKKANVDVVLCHSYGAYLHRTRYSKRFRHGKMHFHYSVLFTKEELASLTEEQLYQKYLQKFCYNDFEWNQTEQNVYKGKEPNITGLENIIYYCPRCHSQFTMHTHKNCIICENCGNTVKMDECYNIEPVGDSVLPFKRVDLWYNHQRKMVAEEVSRQNFELSYKANLIDLHAEKLAYHKYFVNGEGTVTITQKGITYSGTRNNENVEMFFDITAVPSFPFTPNDSNDMFYGENYFGFQPKTDRLKVVKYMLVVEELHNRADPIWNKYSKDVYNEKT